MVAILNYYWLPLATIHYHVENKEFEVWGVFWGVSSNVGEGYSQIFEGSSLGILGNKLLSLATTHLMGDNREFDIWGVFSDVLSFKGRAWSQNFKDL